MLQFLKSMFRAFVSEGLSSHNPFSAFKGKKRETKRRVTIPKQDRKRILSYFHKRGMKGDLAGHHSLSMTENYLHVTDAKRILEANTIRF